MPTLAAIVLAALSDALVLPVLVAVLTTAATLGLARISEAANRRRERYAEAIRTLVAWVEFPYRVRRRTSDDPATLTELATLGHDLQERLACHQAWIATDRPELAECYQRTRAAVSAAVGPAVTEAWSTPPVTRASDMNLGGWGPASACDRPIAELQHRIEARFGLRRLGARRRARRPRSPAAGPVTRVLLQNPEPTGPST
jgi:hypothetical protein